MRQILASELLDEDLGTPAEIQRSLNELWWINQHLGGVSTWRRLLDLWWASQAPPPRHIRLLDVGAGTGEMAVAIAAELRARGCAAETWALDRRDSHLRGGGGVVGDALRLPVADGSVDLVTCNLFFHHFHDGPGEPVATRLLAEMLRAASNAVLINDLDRGWLPYLTIQILGLRFSRITRHDGPRSVRQAYTAGELEALVGATRAARYEVRRLWPYRLGMILWK